MRPNALHLLLAPLCLLLAGSASRAWAEPASEAPSELARPEAGAVVEPPLPEDPFAEPIPFVPPLAPEPIADAGDDPLGLRPSAPLATPDLMLPGDLPQEADAPFGRLADLASKVAPAVVALKTWDASGELLATAVGCFITPDGLILTDIESIHPSIAGRIDSISAVSGDNTAYRIEGLWYRDAETGLTLLKAEAKDATHLRLADRPEFESERPVHVLAFREERGLSLADATIRRDATMGGDGWLSVRGKDSPGSPGSPVIDDAGEVVAMVALRSAEVRWMNFAIPVDGIGALVGAKGIKLTPLAKVPGSSQGRAVDDAEFIEAFKRLYEGRRVTNAAAAEWLRLTRRFPRSAEVWAILGLVCERLGKTEDAVACAAKAAALDPAAGPYWFQLARLSLQADPATPVADAVGGAGEYFENAAKASPGDRLAWFWVGQTRMVRGDAAAAAEAFRRAVQIDPGFGEAAFMLGYALSKAGDLAGAETAVARSTRLMPRDARAWHYLALLQRRAGNPRDAIRSMERATRIEPENRRAWLALAHLYREIGDSANAGVAFARQNRMVSATSAASAAKPGEVGRVAEAGRP